MQKRHFPSLISDSTQSRIQPLSAAQLKSDVPRPHITTSGAIGKPARATRPATARTANIRVMPQSPADWTADFEDSFEFGPGPFPQGWIAEDFSDNLLDRTWGLDENRAFSGARSVWVASGGADGLNPAVDYAPHNLNTWLTISNTMDLNAVQMADVEFYMFMDTEPGYDKIFVGASIDNQTFYGEFWSGDSGGWQYYNLDLSEFIGYDQVYIAWAYESDSDNADGIDYEGVWIDDVAVWTYVDTGPPEATDALLNGDFEGGDLAFWRTPISSTVVVEAETNPNVGDYVAWLGGIENADEIFYQPITLPDSDVTYASFGFWVNQFSEEVEAGADLFCAGLYGTRTGTPGADIDLDNLLIDLGCLDGIDAYTTDFDPEGWWEVDHLLAGDEWEIVRGQTVYVTFEMFTDDSLNTTVYIDDVTVEVVTGGSSGDELEPNDYVDEAISTTVPISYTALTIDPDYDYDFFRVTANAGDTIIVDIDAEVNGSPLDSYAYLFDAQENIVCENDDDEFTLDSYLTCTVETNGVYYVVITSYDGTGERSQVYTLDIQRIPANTEVPTNEAPTNTETPPSTPTAAWTAIIYMDGDTNLCNVYPGLVNRVENELGSKLGPDGFLNVLVLLDRLPIFCEGDGTATRYHVQPNGQYVDGTNRWDMGEINMGDPQTLQSFVEWAKRNYPADHYYLALDNHGAGVTGIAWDDSNRDATNKKDKLTNAELYSVLKSVTDNGASKLDIIAYEACLMGTYENAYDVRTFTDNLFFFPTVSFTNNASYPSYMLDANFTSTTSSRAFGDIMFDVYKQSVTANPYAMTLVDTKHITAVHTTVNAWANELLAQVSTSREKIELARTQAQKIDSNGDKKLTNDDQYLDLWDLADKLVAQGIAVTTGNALKAAIEAAVVRETELSIGDLNYENVHGLSIFWPQTASSWYRRYVDGRIYTATREGQWDEFLNAYYDTEGGRIGMETDPGPAERESATETRRLYLPITAR